MRRLFFGMAMIAAALTAGPASAATTKTFTLAVTPAKVSAGSGQFVNGSAVVTNTGGASKIGSVNIYVPDGLLDVEAGADADRTTSHVIELRRLAIPQNGSVTVSFKFRPPTDEGIYSWSARAKQSETFSERDNDWLLVGDRPTTEAGSTGSSFQASTTCSPNQQCSVQMRHAVPCSHVESLPGPHDCGGAAAAAGDGLDSRYWVEALVETSATSGSLTLGFLSPDEQGQANFASRCDGGGLIDPYREPSNSAARFDGPHGQSKTLRYRISSKLWNATMNAQVESCFSAPYFHEQAFPDPPFQFEGDTWYNGILPNCSGASASDAGPCVVQGSRKDVADSSGQVVAKEIEIFVPWPVLDGEEDPTGVLGGPDPMHN